MDFFNELKKLAIARPQNAISSKGVSNTACSDFVIRSKNIYMSFYIVDCDDCYYAEYINRSRDCLDCSFMTDSELCYECFDCHECFDCRFLDSCIRCSESEYLQNCYNCQNCFGCVGQMNKQFCILNRQFTQEEYFVALNKLKNELKEAKKYGKTLADVLC